MTIITNLISAVRVAFGYCPKGWCVCEKTGNLTPDVTTQDAFPWTPRRR